MDVVILGESRNKNQSVGTGQIVERPSGSTFAGRYTSVILTSGTLRFTRISVPATLFSDLSQEPALAVKAGPVATTVVLTNFDKALPVFKKCESDLLETWGVDPVAIEKDHAPKAITPDRQFLSDDYPPAAVSAGISGRVTTVLRVDATGTVVDCRVVTSAGKELNEATCKRARAIRYTPGTDGSGHPVTSIGILSVRWALP